MVDPEDDRSWPEYRRLVLSELERIDKRLSGLYEKLDKDFESRDIRMRSAEISIAMLQVKCGMWGGLSGAVSAGLMLLLKH